MEQFLSSLGIKKRHQITFSSAVQIRTVQPMKSAPPNMYPEYMLLQIMRASSLCRSLPPPPDPLPRYPMDAFSDDEDSEESSCVHPMDVLTYLFQCSHPLFTQTLSLQLSKCQLSIPLVIPAPDTSQPVYYQFALRPLIRNYSRGTRDTPLSLAVASQQLPVVCFLRVGEYGRTSHSKSRLLNRVFGNRSECFFNRSLTGSIQKRLLFNGTIETAWYVPNDSKTDLYSTPVTFLNLRGDALLYPKQRSLLASVSTLAFVFFSMEHLSEGEFQQLKQIYTECESKKIVLVIVTVDKKKLQAFREAFSDPFDSFKLQNGAEGADVEKLEASIQRGLKERGGEFKISLDAIAAEAEKLGMRLDTSQLPHLTTQGVEDLTSLLHSPSPPGESPAEFSLPLQHVGWPDWCLAQRERHTMHAVGENMGEMSRRIRQKCKSAIRKQVEVLDQSVPFLRKFLHYCKVLTLQSGTFEYLWKMLITQLDIDSNTQRHHRQPSFSSLNLQYSTESFQMRALTGSVPVVGEGTKAMYSCIRGEHILRELGQLFQLYESVSLSERNNIDGILPYSPSHLPQLAAELLLRGHTFEIMDGDVNHVPVRWVKQVLETLSTRIGGNQRVFVIAVLGVQSSGKSTLLNTMFGQHFAVSSARCTRGVLMQLVKAETKETGFDYIVLLDTEGLANRELDSELSRKHDNELATFVVGLSDLTIVNLSMEVNLEVQNILQITVLALIRMQLAYCRPKCIFVHQNVTDVMAPVTLEREREALITHLNESTRSAAIFKHQTDRMIKFTDVINFDPNKDVRYFPCFLEGNQPMTWVSENYSRAAEDLKHYILETNCRDRKMFSTIGEWGCKLENIWRCVLKEDFVFHYTNVKEINDHFELDSVLAGWSFRFSNEMSHWSSNAINKISNAGRDEVTKVWNEVKNELGGVCRTAVSERELEILEEYFESSHKKQSFLKWKDRTVDFFARTRKCEQQRIEPDCFNVFAAQLKLHTINQYFEKTKRFLSEKVRDLLEQMKSENRSFENPEVIDQVFEEQWNEWISSVPSCISIPLIERNLKDDIQLSILNSQCLQAIQNQDKTNLFDVIADYSVIRKIEFELGEHHFSVQNNAEGLIELIKRPYRTFLQLMEAVKATTGLFATSSPDPESFHFSKAQQYTTILNGKCDEFVHNLPTNANYSPAYFTSLIELIATETRKINDEEKSSADVTIEFSNLFILEFSFYQCCRASVQFQKLQDSFLERTNPENQLITLKTDLKAVFTSLCEGIQKEDSAASLLASLLMEGVRKALTDTVQREAVLRFTQEPDHGNIYRTRQLLQLEVLKSLAKRKDFKDYMHYIQYPLQYMESWIKNNLTLYCTMDITIERLWREVLEPALKQKRALICSSGVDSTPDACPAEFSSEVWEKWKVDFHSKISSSVRDVGLDTLSRIDTYSVVNLSQFCEFLSQHLTQRCDQFDWTNWIKGLMLRGLPSQSLVNNLLECRALCPFCREPCQRGGTRHEHYCGSFHRPKGIGGCYHNSINTLSVTDCTNSVGSKRRFWYGERSYAYADYRNINDMFASWRIVPEDAIESRYWQWVMYHFQDQLCTRYKYSRNPEVEEWRHLSEEEIIEDLEKHYQNYCFKTR